MSVWAIADLHLCFGSPQKTMEVFGGAWQNYTEKLKINWEKNVKSTDLVLIPGDISWAIKTADAIIDLNWLNTLPGKKLLIKGNHDYWWPSKTKLKAILPPSIDFLQNDAFDFHNTSIAGSRLWDTSEYSFETITVKTPCDDEKEKIYNRELLRLEASLSQMKDRPIKICMTHFPPIGPDLKDSRADSLLKKYKIDICVFGHLHNISTDKKIFGKKDGINYLLTSADFLNFSPLLIAS
jgi:uncharacterized protein